MMIDRKPIFAITALFFAFPGTNVHAATNEAASQARMQKHVNKITALLEKEVKEEWLVSNNEKQEKKIKADIPKNASFALAYPFLTKELTKELTIKGNQEEKSIKREFIKIFGENMKLKLASSQTEKSDYLFRASIQLLIEYYMHKATTLHYLQAI